LYRRVYPDLTALVLLSDWETGPIVAWEAMQHGATVATTCYRGLTMEGLLLPEVNALVSPVGNVEALAANIERLAVDGQLTLRLRREALRTAVERCSVEASVAGWHAAFLACLAAPIAMELPPPRSATASGRLDHLLGIGRAETLRSLLGQGMLHEGSGGEWPHALVWPAAGKASTAAGWARIEALDAAPPSQTGALPQSLAAGEHCAAATSPAGAKQGM
jgi:hypothetical protein